MIPEYGHTDANAAFAVRRRAAGEAQSRGAVMAAAPVSSRPMTSASRYRRLNGAMHISPSWRRHALRRLHSSDIRPRQARNASE